MRYGTLRAERHLLTAMLLLAAATTDAGDLFPVGAEPDPAQWHAAYRARFDGPRSFEGHAPHLLFNQDIRPYYGMVSPLPADALQLNSSEVNDCYVQTGKGAPHRLLWRLQCRATTNGVTLTPATDGAVFDSDRRKVGLAVPTEWHWVEIERQADRVTVRVAGSGEAVTFIDPGARVPLRVTSRREPLVWLRRADLYVGNGDRWDPVAARPPVRAPLWQEVYRQAFDGPESLKDFVLEGTNSAGTVAWQPGDRCLRLSAREDGPRMDAVLRLHRHLPGDLRIHFRARNVPPEDHFFGVLLACKDPLLPREDGYYCEWNRGWMRRIKKADVQRVLSRPNGPTDRTIRWINYRIERIGPRVAMFTGEEEVLAWVDPAPDRDAEHDRVAFYVCGQEIEFDDIVIDRNGLDALESAAPRPQAAGGTFTPHAAVANAAASDTVIVRPTAVAAEAPSVLPPVISDLRSSATTISFRWIAQSDCEYEVQMCNSLLGKPEWTPVPGWTAIRATEVVQTFSAPASSNGHSFYRVVVQPVVR